MATEPQQSTNESTGYQAPSPPPRPAIPPGRSALAWVITRPPWMLLVGVLVLIILVCGTATLLIGLGNRGAPPTPGPALTPGSPTTGVSGTLGPLQIVSLVTASGIDATNRPTTTTPVFTTTQTIYAVAEVHNIALGMTFFARWRHENEVYEDSYPITAPQAWEYNFIEFHLRPNSGQAFPLGNYTVQIYVDGAPQQTARFVVQ